MVHVCLFVCFALFYFILILICFAWVFFAFFVLFIGFYLLVIVMLCFVYIFFIVIFCRGGEGGGYRGTYYFWNKPADMPLNNIVLIWLLTDRFRLGQITRSSYIYCNYPIKEEIADNHQVSLVFVWCYREGWEMIYLYGLPWLCWMPKLYKCP